MPPVFVFSHFWLLFNQTDKKKEKKKTITRKSFMVSCEEKPLKLNTLSGGGGGRVGGSGGRLKMCEEALSNQVKEKEKKKSFVRNRRK